MKTEPKSKCCNTKVIVVSGYPKDEGTHYYQCEKCGQPCDIHTTQIVKDKVSMTEPKKLECWEKKMKTTYCSMKSRCNNPKSTEYHNYGGRGIKCLWKNREEFIKDMLPTYKEGLSIDRIDNDGNYCKENCRWASRYIQSRNTRANLLITYKGITQPLIVWTEQLGLPYKFTQKRMKEYGWTFEEAITRPKNYHNKVSKLKKIYTQSDLQSLIQSTKEETIREIMGLDCMNQQSIAKFLPNDVRKYNATRNQLRNQIKSEINSLLKK